MGRNKNFLYLGAPSSQWSSDVKNFPQPYRALENSSSSFLGQYAMQFLLRTISVSPSGPHTPKKMFTSVDLRASPSQTPLISFSCRRGPWLLLTARPESLSLFARQVWMASALGTGMMASRTTRTPQPNGARRAVSSSSALRPGPHSPSTRQSVMAGTGSDEGNLRR